MGKSKILFLDIETIPNKVYTWGLWNQNVSILNIIEPGRIICWSAKWEDGQDIVFASEWNDGRKKMLKKLHKLLDEADFVVHFNGYTFDIPWINAEFVVVKLLPPSPYKQIDLLKTITKAFRFPSNKLDYVCPALGIGAKVKTPGFQLWLDCMAKKPEAFATMEKYNRYDVVLTEKLYKRIQPWIAYHPHRALTEFACPACGGHHLQRRGSYLAKTRTYQRYVCKDCGSWSRATKSDKGKAQIVSVKP